MKNRDRSFVLISAWADETQHCTQIRSIQLQVECSYKHLIIEGLSALEAEREIFQRSKEVSSCADFIVKLDGDMTFSSSHSLKEIGDWFDDPKNKNFGRLSLPVFDFFSLRYIMGINSWRADWTPDVAEISPPFPDAWISKIKGKCPFICKRFGRINHAFAPSLSQSFRYGWHRGVKALEKNAESGYWSLAYCVERAFRQYPLEISRGAALLGFKCGLGLCSDIALKWNDNSSNSIVWADIGRDLEAKTNSLSKALLKREDAVELWQQEFSPSRFRRYHGWESLKATSKAFLCLP